MLLYFFRFINGKCQIIYDEYGPVLISYPLNFFDTNFELRSIKLFHIGDYFLDNFRQIQQIFIRRRFIKNGII